ncbi:MAG: YiiD C-terminal domain-containing protein [Gammaproteobacteria bacterium]|nr:YiiD C-terminal domain-containing protein [Gammaproteobacteria bacterium]
MSLNLQPIFNLSDKDPQKLMNNWRELPCTNNTGAEVTYISDNIDTVVVKIPFNEQTKNFMGILYGGTMYAATDAVYLTMLWYQLGEDYIVLDKSSQVKYLRPGIEDLTAEFHVPESDVVEIKQELENKKSVSREYIVEIKDSKGKCVCKITKDIVIRKR